MKLYEEYVLNEKFKILEKVNDRLIKLGKDTKDFINKQNELNDKEDDGIPIVDSPILLSGSNVVQGIGQMLVLAVGKNR